MVRGGSGDPAAVQYRQHGLLDEQVAAIERLTLGASVHDSQALETLLDAADEEKPLYADSAYVGQDKMLEEKKVDARIHEKGYRNRSLNEAQKEANHEKSKVRSRVEHIFGFIENSMGGSFIRCIGKTRAKATIGLMNLTYNMFRALQITSIKGITASI